MSIGYQAYADLVVSDKTGILYAYACCNLNLPEKRDTDWNTEDGEIWISRDALPEPEIHEKLRKMPSGKRKMVIKRIPHWVSAEELISKGKVTVRNACGTWETTGGTDMMALRILNKIFVEYQEQGKIPEQVSVVF